MRLTYYVKAQFSRQVKQKGEHVEVPLGLGPSLSDDPRSSRVWSLRDQLGYLTSGFTFG